MESKEPLILAIKWGAVRARQRSDVPTGPLADFLLAPGGVLDEAASDPSAKTTLEKLCVNAIRLRPALPFRELAAAALRRLEVNEGSFARRKDAVRLVWGDAFTFELLKAWSVGASLGRGKHAATRAWLCMGVLRGPSSESIREALDARFGILRGDDAVGYRFRSGLARLLDNLTHDLERPGGYTARDIGRFAGSLRGGSHRARHRHRKLIEKLTELGLLESKHQAGLQPRYRFTGQLTHEASEDLQAQSRRRGVMDLASGSLSCLRAGGREGRGLTHLPTYFSSGGFHLVGPEPPEWFAYALAGAIDFGLMLTWLSLGAPPKHYKSSGDFRPPSADPLDIAKWIDEKYPIALDRIRVAMAALREGRWVSPETEQNCRVNAEAEMKEWMSAILRARTIPTIIGDVPEGTRAFEALERIARFPFERIRVPGSPGGSGPTRGGSGEWALEQARRSVELPTARTVARRNTTRVPRNPARCVKA